MKSLRSKASRFFKDGPSQDEKVANAESDGGEGFSAGIQDCDIKKKPRFFSRKNDTTERHSPGPPSTASSSTLVVDGKRSSDSNNPPYSTTSSRIPQSQLESDNSQLPQSRTSSTASSPTKPGTDALKVKSRPSFATLRSKSSRLFRNNTAGTSCPPPPPIPQIPIDPAISRPKRPTLTQSQNARRRSSSSSSTRIRGRSISRPILLQQLSNPPIPELPITVAFNKPGGPPPARPLRPETLDDDLVAFMQQGDTRMVIMNSNRVSDSTASSSTTRSHASSIEARLGLPSGHGTPRTNSLDSPLAAHFSPDIAQPLPVQDSAGNVTVSRFSQYIRSEVGGYAGDGVDEEDRDLGPIECYDKKKENEWVLMKRVSKGPNGNPGMLFRDTLGGFHFVADI